MTSSQNISISSPSIEQGKPRLLAGLSRRYEMGNNAGIPNQWQAFGPWLDNIPGQAGDGAYGVVYNMDDDDNYEYLCAVEVLSFDSISDELDRLRVPEQTYAVFRHEGHVSEVQTTCGLIFSEWLPGSQYESADAPFFEYYPPTFDPETGHGGFEVWVPVTQK